MSNNKKKIITSSSSSETSSESSIRSSSETSESYYGTNSSSDSESNVSDSSDIDYSTNGDEFINDIINNQYMLLYKIGYGSFSSVWLTYNIDDNKFYAMKIQTPDDYEEGIEELKIYEIISKICKQNKNIKTLMMLKYSFILEKGKDKYVCMVMDLMAGSLYDIIKTEKYHRGLPEQTVERIEKQMNEAVKLLHNFDIIHSDIKPENILVCGINKKYQKIMDKFNKLKLKEKFDENINEIKKLYNLNNQNDKNKFKKDKYKILLEINKFIHKVINFEEILSDRHSDLFTEDQVNNIQIKLADFGSIQYEQDLKNEDYYPEVTTRYYRDPRVVLGIKYDKTIDDHALICTLHELKTGIIKYNPDLLRDDDTDNNYSLDFYHILLFLKDNLIKEKWLKLCPKFNLLDELKEASLIKK
jgi:hypothetical protein